MGDKRVFDWLLQQKAEIEDELGEPLAWERFEGTKATRLALYRPGHITDAPEELDALRKWAVKAMIRFEKVTPRPSEYNHRGTMITQADLETYLWGAATLLRGNIDAGDYKQFIFPLMFFKRLCDVYDEETQNAAANGWGGIPRRPPLPDPRRRALVGRARRHPPTSAWRFSRPCTPSRAPTRTC